MKSISYYIPEKNGRTIIPLGIVIFAVGICVYDSWANSGRNTLLEVIPSAIATSHEQLEKFQSQGGIQQLVSSSPAPASVGLSHVPIKAGLSEADVTYILGEPEGMISSPVKSVWVYGPRRIEFEGGRVVAATLAEADELPEDDLSQFVPLEEKVRINLKSIGDWATDVAVHLKVFDRGIVLLDKEGDPTHKGRVVVEETRPMRANVLSSDVGSDEKETTIILHKVEEGEVAFRGDVIGSHSLQ